MGFGMTIFCERCDFEQDLLLGAGMFDGPNKYRIAARCFDCNQVIAVDANEPSVCGKCNSTDIKRIYALRREPSDECFDQVHFTRECPQCKNNLLNSRRNGMMWD